MGCYPKLCLRASPEWKIYAKYVGPSWLSELGWAGTLHQRLLQKNHGLPVARSTSSKEPSWLMDEKLNLCQILISNLFVKLKKELDSKFWERHIFLNVMAYVFVGIQFRKRDWKLPGRLRKLGWAGWLSGNNSSSASLPVQTSFFMSNSPQAIESTNRHLPGQEFCTAGRLIFSLWTRSDCDIVNNR